MNQPQVGKYPVAGGLASGARRPATEEHGQVEAVDDTVTIQITDRWVRQTPETEQLGQVGTIDTAVEVEIPADEVTCIGDAVVIGVVLAVAVAIAITTATCSETAPCRSRSSAGTPTSELILFPAWPCHDWAVTFHLHAPGRTVVSYMASHGTLFYPERCVWDLCFSEN